jgi:hypothetical protein
MNKGGHFWDKARRKAEWTEMWPAGALADREARRIAEIDLRLSQLNRKLAAALKNNPGIRLEDALSRAEYQEYVVSDAESTGFPAASVHYLPTRLGNLLRGAEMYPQIRYGLEIQVTWPRLWLVLPEETRKELGESRRALDERMQLVLWCILIGVWAEFSGWAVALALVGAVVVYWSLIGAAGIYADLLRSAYDLHRFKLYEALHLPKPLRAEDESAAGEALLEPIDNSWEIIII